MSIFFNSNFASAFARLALKKHENNLAKNLERISSGLRINSAADDVAGNSISTKLSAEILSLSKASQNVSDGISMVQTTETALTSIQTALQSIRALAVQAYNGTYSESELATMQEEVNDHVSNIADYTSSTKFNGISLIDGAAANHADITIQAGANNGETLTLSFASIDTRVDQTAANTLGEGAIALNAFNIGSTSTAAANGVTTSANGDLDDIDAMLDNVARMISQVGAEENALDSRSTFLSTMSTNLQTARGRIIDADTTKETTEYLKNGVLREGAIAVLAYANQLPKIVLNLFPS